ncbi:glycosyltransferase [Marinobacter sediminum]|uniref:glycosyltransferase n=1 Tax=Marinobacter sediminum TaxID=256323 RepID=UPI00193ADF4C|nr:glycosyltransferase [Marinobacter sediminum]
MSSPNSGVKLLLKKLEVSFRKHGPDHFIFQSEGMRNTAVTGRGIPKSRTSVVKTGIDTEQFAPDPNKRFYAHDSFDIPRDRRIIVFSGHMERRKGVHVILQAASSLIHRIKRRDVHFLILGNRAGELESFSEYLNDDAVSAHVTFGGYRSDVADLLKSCSIGMIASTEWDSFPMSSLEMASSALPLLVSDLPGLNEAVTPLTGMKFPVGDHEAAADAVDKFLSAPHKLLEYGQNGRQRVLKEYCQESQARGILSVFRTLEQNLEKVS